MKKINIVKFKKLKKHKNKHYYQAISEKIKIKRKFCNPYIIITLVFAIIAVICLIFFILKNIGYNSYINVAYSFDNNYYYITHVSMKSIMLNQNSKTFIDFYMLCSNATYEQKKIIDKICIQHKNCKITYFDMGEQFKGYHIPKNFATWTTPIFYRMMLQHLLPKENKVLYLDSDTLIYKDLTKIYNTDIKNKYYIGMLEYCDFKMKYYDEKFNNNINTGVLLCNLDELRKGNLSEIFIEFYKKHSKEIRYPVNEALNIISHHKNGIFAPEFVVIAFCDENEAYDYYKNFEIKINRTAVKEAFKDPYIYHYIYHTKPWKGIHKRHNKICTDRFIRFYEMVRKTDIYYEFLKKYSF